MNVSVFLTPKTLPAFLLDVATVRPVFIWGQPGIGKSDQVTQFAKSLNLPCQSILGSQVAPEDLIGVPRIVDNVSEFCPPASIARKEPYCLFLDELNACSLEVQKAFYSLIHERRLGTYELPKGSIIIGAGNRAQDSAIVKPLSSALINRMVHVQLQSNTADWLHWAHGEAIHPDIINYIETHPHHLCAPPPKTQEQFSTPRSWHSFSDCLKNTKDSLLEDIKLKAYGCLSPDHASQFIAHIKVSRSKYKVDDLIAGKLKWPAAPEDRDVLFYLVQAFRDRIIRELPPTRDSLTPHQKQLTHQVKSLLKDLTLINLEFAQVVVADTNTKLPDWIMPEIIRDLPRLVKRDPAKP